MENVGTIFVNIDPFNLFTVDISTDMVPFINDFYFFTTLGCLMSKIAPDKPAPTIR